MGLLATAVAWAQTTAARPTAATTARRQANIIEVGGEPVVLMWARGLADPADLEVYAGCGFNTVYVLVEGASEAQLATLEAILAGADARGLYVICAFTPGSVRGENGATLAPDPTSSAYKEAVWALVAEVAEAVRNHRSLIGWSVEGVPPEALEVHNASFAAYLQHWYDGSLARLNASWGTAFANWDQVSLDRVRDVDALRPGGLGRASVDYAAYREAAYADVLSIWADAIREAAPGQLVFASALTDYRSIISVPDAFDGCILNTYPTVAEVDWDTHNVHAVDIARRANEFAAIPTLWVESNVEIPRTGDWINLALLHGAAGIAFSSWSAVEASEGLRALAQQAAAVIPEMGAFPTTPRNRAAIVYQPLAGGAVRNNAALYGYLDGVTPAEPTGLFAFARHGSRYGQFDVLATDSLMRADLSRYGTILVPMALFLPEDAQVALHSFVLRGGALVVDAGVGMYQAEGTVDTMPPIVSEMLGMRFADMVGPEGQPSELGSLGQPGQVGPPGVAVPVGPGEAGLTIDPDVARFADYLSQFLSRPDVRTYLGEEFMSEEGPGFRVRGLGRGYAVYAPTFLWASWDPSDPYFNEFHDRVLSWRHDLIVIQPDSIWPGVSAALLEDGAVAVASPAQLAAVVDVYGVRNRLYQVPAGAMRVGNPAEEEAIELLFPGEPMAVATALPVFVRVGDPGAIATVTVEHYGPDGIALVVNGVGAEANATREGVRVLGGNPTTVEIEIRDGAYRVAAGSTHRLRVEEGVRARVREQELMPDPDARALVVQGVFSNARILITPSDEAGETTGVTEG